MREQIKKTIIKNKRGFSILEVLVAVGIFSVGIVGISSLMLQSMQAESLNAGYLKASMFAQEGLELVRFARDENWLTEPEVSWDTYFAKAYLPDDAFDVSSTFAIDYDLNIDAVPDDISDPETILYLNGNLYSHNSAGAPTSYRRLITIEDCDIPDPDCWKVKARVDWTSSARSNTYTAETLLYNWR